MATAPFALPPGEGERLVFGDVTILLRASAVDTGGHFSLFEEVPPLVDTPAHVHAHEDELFYVLEGEHVFRIGDEEFRLGPGGMAFAPRGLPHSHARVRPGAGRLLDLMVPGGFERFFRALALAHEDGTLGPEAYATASSDTGITSLPGD